MNCPICGTPCAENRDHHGPGSYSLQCDNQCYYESRAYGNTNVAIGYEDDDRLTLNWPDDTPEEEVKARRILIGAFAEFFIYMDEALSTRSEDAVDLDADEPAPAPFFAVGDAVDLNTISRYQPVPLVTLEDIQRLQRNMVPLPTRE